MVDGPTAVPSDNFVVRRAIACKLVTGSAFAPSIVLGIVLVLACVGSESAPVYIIACYGCANRHLAIRTIAIAIASAWARLYALVPLGPSSVGRWAPTIIRVALVDLTARTGVRVCHIPTRIASGAAANVLAWPVRGAHVCIQDTWGCLVFAGVGAVGALVSDLADVYTIFLAPN